MVEADRIATPRAEKVQLFVNTIFAHNTGIHYKKKLKHILVASVLIFHDEFLGIIGNEPSGKYKDPINHPFYQKILSIIIELKISDETFEKWNKEVIDGFNGKYWLGVNIYKAGSGYSKRYVDICCVISLIYKQ